MSGEEKKKNIEEYSEFINVMSVIEKEIDNLTKENNNLIKIIKEYKNLIEPLYKTIDPNLLDLLRYNLELSKHNDGI